MYRPYILYHEWICEEFERISANDFHFGDKHFITLLFAVVDQSLWWSATHARAICFVYNMHHIYNSCENNTVKLHRTHI